MVSFSCKTLDTKTMKIPTSFLASLAVASLTPLLIFAEIKTKNEVKVVERKAARKELHRNYHSDWNLHSRIGEQDTQQSITWTEILHLPFASIPINPSYLPGGGAESLDQTLNRIVTELTMQESTRSNEPAVAFGSWRSADEFVGNFCVACTRVPDAAFVFSQPIGQEPNASTDDFELPSEMSEKLESHTDVVFADFQLSREQGDRVAESIHFRLWYDYSSGEWREVTRRQRQHEGQLEKWLAGKM